MKASRKKQASPSHRLVLFEHPFTISLKTWHIDVMPLYAYLSHVVRPRKTPIPGDHFDSRFQVSMKRFFSMVFISLYLYNIVGYLALFTMLQYQVRNDVKTMLKAGVSEEELVTFAFHTASLYGGAYGIQWIDENEFRYKGHMYDIVQMSTTNDTSYLVCINDLQEKQLFENLDSQVRREMGGSSKPGKLDSFKDVFKNSYVLKPFDVKPLRTTEIIGDLPEDRYVSADLDIPLHPPRLI